MRLCDMVVNASRCLLTTERLLRIARINCREGLLRCPPGLIASEMVSGQPFLTPGNSICRSKRFFAISLQLLQEIIFHAIAPETCSNSLHSIV